MSSCALACWELTCYPSTWSPCDAPSTPSTTPDYPLVAPGCLLLVRVIVCPGLLGVDLLPLHLEPLEGHQYSTLSFHLTFFSFLFSVAFLFFYVVCFLLSIFSSYPQPTILLCFLSSLFIPFDLFRIIPPNSFIIVMVFLYFSFSSSLFYNVFFFSFI